MLSNQLQWRSIHPKHVPIWGAGNSQHSLKDRFFSFQHPSALVEHHVNIFPKYQTSLKHYNESTLSGSTNQRHAGALKNNMQPKGLRQPGSKKSYYSRTRILNDTQRLKNTPKPSSSFLPNNPTSCSQNLRIEWIGRDAPPIRPTTGGSPSSPSMKSKAVATPTSVNPWLVPMRMVMFATCHLELLNLTSCLKSTVWAVFNVRAVEHFSYIIRSHWYHSNC